MDLGISREKPVGICYGMLSMEYLCTIVSRAIIRAVEGLKIVWPAGRKRKVIVWINILYLYPQHAFIFFFFGRWLLIIVHFTHGTDLRDGWLWGRRDRVLQLWKCLRRCREARGGCRQGRGSGSMQSRRHLCCTTAGFKFRTLMWPNVKSEMCCWKCIISSKWLPCKSQEWKLASG